MPVDLVALEEDLCLKAETCMAFPLKLSDTTIQKAISYFQVQITNAMKYKDHICCFYSQFVDLAVLNLISDNIFILMAVFEINILYSYNLDICNYSETFNFSHDCLEPNQRKQQAKIWYFQQDITVVLPALS